MGHTLEGELIGACSREPGGAQSAGYPNISTVAYEANDPPGSLGRDDRQDWMDSDVSPQSPVRPTLGPHPAIEPARTIAPCSRTRLRRSVERANDGDVSFERRAVWSGAAPCALSLPQLHPQPARRFNMAARLGSNASSKKLSSGVAPKTAMSPNVLWRQSIAVEGQRG